MIFLDMVFLLLIPCEFLEFLKSVFLHLLSILEKFSNIFSPNIASVSFPFSSLSEPQLYKQHPYLLWSICLMCFFLHMIIFTFCILFRLYSIFYIEVKPGKQSCFYVPSFFFPPWSHSLGMKIWLLSYPWIFYSSLGL